MCNLKFKFLMDSNIYVSVHRYAYILSKEFDMKRWLHPRHRGEELFSFLLGYSKSRLEKEQKKSTMLLLLFKSFFLDKKEQRRTRKLCNQIKSKNEDEWCKCLTKPPLLLTENRLFCSYKLFFPRVRCEGALRLPKFLFMAIRVVES